MFDVTAIVALIQAASSVIKTGVETYNAVQGTLSETDAAKIHAALLEAQAATASLRPQVDAALIAAEDQK